MFSIFEYIFLFWELFEYNEKFYLFNFQAITNMAR